MPDVFLAFSEARIAGALGGRAAEQLVFGTNQVTTGHGDDAGRPPGTPWAAEAVTPQWCLLVYVVYKTRNTIVIPSGYD